MYRYAGQMCFFITALAVALVITVITSISISRVDAPTQQANPAGDTFIQSGH
jgi:hypothetical protein